MTTYETVGPRGDGFTELVTTPTTSTNGNGNGHSYQEIDPLHEPKDYHLTEFGNTERLLDRHGQDIRYNKAFGYIVWNGQKWEIDKDTAVESLAWATVRDIYRDIKVLYQIAHKCPDDDARKKLAERAEKLSRHARLSETQSMITAMTKLARGHCFLDAEKFDTHPHLLNFSNGTLDLRAWAFRPHAREDYLTFCISHAYNPHAESPVFKAFLHDVTQGNQELTQFLQKSLGYALTADNQEHLWFLLIGAGENGKTTLGDAILYCMEEYATRIDEKTISVVSGSSRDGGSASPDIARLKGKRLGIVAETEEGARIASSRIKDMAGGERVTARYLNRNNFEFRYSHKLFIYTNHELVVHDTSHGFWRRVRRIPFSFTVPPEKKDKGLPEKLQAEAEGILAWMVEGERLRQSEGMEPPEIVKQATQQYRESQDVLSQFIRDFCITGRNEWIQAKEIQGKFKTWLDEEMGMKPLSMPTFKRMMLDHGFKNVHSRHGKIYTGVRFKTDNELEQEHTDCGEKCDLVTDVTDYIGFSPIENIPTPKIQDNPSHRSQGHTLGEEHTPVPKFGEQPPKQCYQCHQYTRTFDTFRGEWECKPCLEEWQREEIERREATHEV